MPSLLKHERISRFLRDLAHLGYHANGNLSVAAADAIDDLLEEIRVIRANHDQMCKDFDARNELLEKEQQAHLLTKGTLMVRTEQLAAERRIYKAARPGTAMPRPEQRREPSNEFWFGDAGPEFDNWGVPPHGTEQER